MSKIDKTGNPDGVREGVLVEDVDCDGVSDAVIVGVGVLVEESEREGDSVCETVRVTLFVPDSEGDCVTDIDCDIVSTCDDVPVVD